MIQALGVIVRSAVGAAARSGRIGGSTASVARGAQAVGRYRASSGGKLDQQQLGQQLGVNILELVQSIRAWRDSVVESRSIACPNTKRAGAWAPRFA